MLLSHSFIHTSTLLLSSQLSNHRVRRVQLGLHYIPLYCHLLHWPVKYEHPRIHAQQYIHMILVRSVVLQTPVFIGLCNWKPLFLKLSEVCFWKPLFLFDCVIGNPCFCSITHTNNSDFEISRNYENLVKFQFFNANNNTTFRTTLCY